MIQPVISFRRGSMNALVWISLSFFSAHFVSQCFSASFGSTDSYITIRVVSGDFCMNSRNFLRADGLLYFEEGFARRTNLRFARNGMALTALFRSFSSMERASRRAVFMSALVGSVKSESNSLSLRVIANSSLPKRKYRLGIIFSHRAFFL